MAMSLFFFSELGQGIENLFTLKASF